MLSSRLHCLNNWCSPRFPCSHHKHAQSEYHPTIIVPQILVLAPWSKTPNRQNGFVSCRALSCQKDLFCLRKNHCIISKSQTVALDRLWSAAWKNTQYMCNGITHSCHSSRNWEKRETLLLHLTSLCVWIGLQTFPFLKHSDAILPEATQHHTEKEQIAKKCKIFKCKYCTTKWDSFQTLSKVSFVHRSGHFQHCNWLLCNYKAQFSMCVMSKPSHILYSFIMDAGKCPQSLWHISVTHHARTSQM